MVYTPGPKGQPQVSTGGAVSAAADLTAVADYAARVGNRIVGTASQRATFAATYGVSPWDGLEFAEVDTGKEFVYLSGGWRTYPLVDTAEEVGAFTQAAGWTILFQSAFRIGQIARVIVQYQRSAGTITVGSDGDIANQTIATFRPGWEPYPGNSFPLPTGTSGPITATVVDPAFGLRLAAIAPGATIVNGSTFSVGGLYILEN